MSIQTILDSLLKEKLIISEVFDSGHKIHYGNKSDYVEVFRNPDLSEVANVVNAASYDGAKIGVDKKGDVYVWVDDILHSIMQRSLGKDFTMRFDYTKGNPILYLAQGMTKEEFDKYGTPAVIKRLKSIFPEITSIEQVSRPFLTVYTYKD